MQENKQLLSSQAKPAVERDFIPNLFTGRQNDEQPSADSHTAYNLYLEWRKDEGENGPAITKTAFTQKLNDRHGPARRGKKNVQGKQRPRNTWFWDHLTLDETQDYSLSHPVGGSAIDPPLRNTLQTPPVHLPLHSEIVRKNDATAYVTDDFSCQSLSDNDISEHPSEAQDSSRPDPDRCRGCIQKELPEAADPFGDICPDCNYQGNLQDGCPAADCLECHPRTAE